MMPEPRDGMIEIATISGRMRVPATITGCLAVHSRLTHSGPDRLFTVTHVATGCAIPVAFPDRDSAIAFAAAAEHLFPENGPTDPWELAAALDVKAIISLALEHMSITELSSVGVASPANWKRPLPRK